MKSIFVYIAHPFTSDPLGNIVIVKKHLNILLNYNLYKNTDECICPVSPHLLLSAFEEDNNPHIREYTEKYCQELVGRCDELWVLSNNISPGMKLEINVAKKIGLPIKRLDDLKHIFEK